MPQSNHKPVVLLAAPHTPFHADESLNPAVIDQQAAHLARHGIDGVFINGTTGESHSLTVEERKTIASHWAAVARGSGLRVFVHVGANSVHDAMALARHAAGLGGAVEAVAAISPSYFKPRCVKDLVDCAAMIAAAAPSLPFYLYDIPSMTGVSLSMPEFLEQARDRIPNLRGLKYSNPDLLAYQHCLNADGGRWDVPWGTDESLLAAVTLGARSAVGSTYSFAAPIYRRMLAAFSRGDLEAARVEQFRSAQTVQTLSKFGYMGAAKALMRRLGINVGPARLPLANPAAEQEKALIAALDELGFFGWL